MVLPDRIELSTSPLPIKRVTSIFGISISYSAIFWRNIDVICCLFAADQALLKFLGLCVLHQGDLPISSKSFRLRDVKRN
jgi:hypothetical protein